MPETLPLLSNLEMPAATGAATSPPTSAGEAPPAGLFAGIVAELMEAVAVLDREGDTASLLAETGKEAEVLPGGGNPLPPEVLLAMPLPVPTSEPATVAVRVEAAGADTALTVLVMASNAHPDSANAATANAAPATAGAVAAPERGAAPLLNLTENTAAPPTPVALSRAVETVEQARTSIPVIEEGREALPKPEPAVAAPAPPFASAPALGAVRAELTVPLRQPGWDEALGNRVVWLAGQQIKAAELHLNPPQLGPIDVQIRMADNQASIEFGTHHALVRDAIESALPKLREMFAAQGLNLADVNVSQQSFAHGREQPATGEARASTEQGPGGAQTAAPPAAAERVLGLVDLYA